ncbi:MAG TPA: HD domain-containing phosphohydrolase, partial [Desulfosalsimonadaceae bacterium]|nr:HD domain-containing phosphohydrolase [Desulfosalsimonadaceae bacterium]
HHEKWDGSGYPRGLKGEEIPLSARIFAIVDVWDALRYPRVYKAAWSENSVLEFLEQQAGIQFDPEIARLFLDAYEQLKRAALTSLENEESRFSHLLPQSVA